MPKRVGEKLDASRKRGRQGLRKIRRAGSGKSPHETLTGSRSEETPHNKPKEEDRLSDSPRDQLSELEGPSGKAYGALLTILNAEHPDIRQRKSKKVTQESIQDMNEEENITEDQEDDLEANLADMPAELSDDEISEDEDSENEQDPFETHFNAISEDIDHLDEAYKEKKIINKSGKISVDEEESLIYTKTLSNIEAKFEMPSHRGSLSRYFLKRKLQLHNDLLNGETTLSALQKKIVDPIFQYKDLLYEYNDYEQDEEQYRDLYTIHVLNHVYKTRDRILKDNQRLATNPDSEYLDQGFTRPKVLIVAPTRDTAYHIVNKIIDKSGLDQVDKKGKFKDQFFQDALPPSHKPKSFRHTFKGNTNDFFVLGIKFTRKAIRLYSNFYQSDIIVCSPLGLQLIVENTDRKKRQDDFLSSIELMIIDQLHAIEFQNVSHLFTIFEHINKIPQGQHDTDFGRVRMWYINDQAKLLRQTLVFTRYITPTANFLINGKCRNMAGRWKNHRQILPQQCSVSRLGIRIRQIFQRIDLGGATVADEPDYRFRFFTSVIVPSITKTTGYEDGILLYVPDYADFVRVRNYLREKSTILFGDINEYTESSILTSNRSLFQQGRIKVLLYTERLHHFRRYEIRGVKSVIFYQPPSNPEFYNEVVRCIGKSALLGTDLNISTVRCIYSKLDGLALERIVGTKRAAVLTHGQNEVFEFK
ncbi:UTP25 (YIL091C) [Zygosaccharomyces parabailii]|uniref:U3 small nucleolar RNA-associated protein 25 n=1 Tax=Zygosaccharomyces bailii (strain CLIB 213 / ATCC 58445 / CBS 680 / BCRC 21525 / NBRC 1098 / NCYC 1416 / NRRL Y-2227) TaxID=1333698 RepID=A0A8J2T730_ZYGB2|nr:UTP25 (YIL091C) [Zygosaccharomyces parabailii]CDF89517.1 ZYBA0S04-06150g1_1 [Zygosaccharomyces bailii CLIB 213]